ncbi:hypothetical protein BVRB_2g038780 isoform A [Beta vulgaris subsp. vulgaris]|nr:hypothetical protein BVRB_2g038780 isoform A [Beta vulgaris subsp. vulgaris]
MRILIAIEEIMELSNRGRMEKRKTCEGNCANCVTSNGVN